MLFFFPFGCLICSPLKQNFPSNHEFFDVRENIELSTLLIESSSMETKKLPNPEFYFYKKKYLGNTWEFFFSTYFSRLIKKAHQSFTTFIWYFDCSLYINLIKYLQCGKLTLHIISLFTLDFNFPPCFYCWWLFETWKLNFQSRSMYFLITSFIGFCLATFSLIESRVSMREETSHN